MRIGDVVMLQKSNVGNSSVGARPAMIVSVLEDTDVMAVVPLCKDKYDGSYRVRIEFSNNRDVTSLACIDQLRYVGPSQVGIKLGETNIDDFVAVKKAIQESLGLPV